MSDRVMVMVCTTFLQYQRRRFALPASRTAIGAALRSRLCSRPRVRKSDDDCLTINDRIDIFCWLAVLRALIEERNPGGRVR
jgi:hypothetical protein